MGKFRRRKDDAEDAAPPKLVKTYIKALSIQDLSDLEHIKGEVDHGNIVILKVTPLAKKNLEDVKKAISLITAHVNQLGGDIARLGEERIIITPSNVKIWRKNNPPKEEKSSSI